ncbi:MAG: hypothetical protein ACRYFZ_22295 [Janthinobacterium lividum]
MRSLPGNIFERVPFRTPIYAAIAQYNGRDKQDFQVLLIDEISSHRSLPAALLPYNIRSGKLKLHQNPGYPAIAVFKRVDGHEPKVSNASFEHCTQSQRLVKPGKAHLFR